MQCMWPLILPEEQFQSNNLHLYLINTLFILHYKDLWQSMPVLPMGDSAKHGKIVFLIPLSALYLDHRIILSFLCIRVLNDLIWGRLLTHLIHTRCSSLSTCSMNEQVNGVNQNARQCTVLKWVSHTSSDCYRTKEMCQFGQKHVWKV